MIYLFSSLINVCQLLMFDQYTKHTVFNYIFGFSMFYLIQVLFVLHMLFLILRI